MRATRFGSGFSVLVSPRLILRAVERGDINSRYVGWLNDSDVNRYLETRFVPQTLESVEEYWVSHRDRSDSPWFAISIADDRNHIGNIKLGPINRIHRTADVSLFIGEKSCWGQGFGQEAIATLRDWAFSELDIQKLNAGVYAGNDASRRAFEKCGFEVEGCLKSEVLSGGRRLDVFRLGLPRELWGPKGTPEPVEDRPQ